MTSWVSVSLAIEILRSLVRRHAPPPPKPHLGHAAGGAGSRSAPGARNGHSTALFADECQSFLDNVMAGLGQIGAWDDRRPPSGLPIDRFVPCRDGSLIPNSRNSPRTCSPNSTA